MCVLSCIPDQGSKHCARTLVSVIQIYKIWKVGVLTNTSQHGILFFSTPEKNKTAITKEATDFPTKQSRLAFLKEALQQLQDPLRHNKNCE